jgi:hypothetical protein
MEGEFELEDLYDPETLATLDAWAEPEPDPEGPLPSRVNRWSRRTAAGMVLTGFALGLREVLDPEEERPIVIEIDADGEPAHLPIQLFLDPDSAAGSLCLVRRDPLPRPPVR